MGTVLAMAGDNFELLPLRARALASMLDRLLTRRR